MNEAIEPTKPFGDPSVDTILAELALTEVLKQPGDVCPYHLLRERLGKDPQREAYSCIKTARSRFEREHHCVLEPIKNEGIKWLTPGEVVVNRWDHDIGHASRHSRTMLKRQKTTIGESEKALTPELLKHRNQNLAIAGVLTHMSKPRARRAIAEQADKSGRILAANDVLKHFGKQPESEESS